MSKPVPRDRLQKLCGLFGSQHDGERAAAAALADKLVRSTGLTWRDVIRWPEPAHSPPEMPDIPDDWRGLATRALRHRDQLSCWDGRRRGGADIGHHRPRQAVWALWLPPG